MIKAGHLLSSILILSLVLMMAGYAHGADNLLANGGFEDGVLDPWGTYGDVTAEVMQGDAVEGNSALHITVNTKGANFWDSGLQHAGHIFDAGKTYTLSASLKSLSGPLDINFKPELGADPWTGYGDQAFTMTEEWAVYTITTPPMPEDVDPGTITFHIAYDVGEFLVDDVQWYEGEPVEPADVPELQFENGGFETGAADPWSLYGSGEIEVVTELVGAAVPQGPAEGMYALHVTVNEAGANFWDTGLQNGGHVFGAGRVYTLAAWLKAKEGTLDINFKPELAADPWSGYGDQIFTMTDTWVEYHVTTPPMPETADPASITFHIAFAAGEFWIDGVRFYEGEFVPSEPPSAVSPQGKATSAWGKIKSE